MAIRVKHAPPVFDYAESVYQASLLRAAQEEAQRRQQESQQALAMEAQQFNLDTARQREQERVQASQPAPNTTQGAEYTTDARFMPPVPATASKPLQGQGAVPASSPASSGLSSAQASVLREVIQQGGQNDRTLLEQRGRAQQTLLEHELTGESDDKALRRNLRQAWQEKLMDMQAEDMQFTVQQQREQQEITNNLNALDAAYDSGRISPDQYRGAFENLQARLFGMEGMPNPATPKPPAPEEVLGRIIEHPGLGWVTVDANGNIKVLNPPKSDSKQIEVNRTAVERRAREMAMAHIPQDQRDTVTDATISEMAKGYTEQAHAELMVQEQQVAALNAGGEPDEEAVAPEAEVSFGEQVLKDPEAFEGFVSGLAVDEPTKMNIRGAYEQAVGYHAQVVAQQEALQERMSRPPIEVLQNPAKMKAWESDIQLEMARNRAVADKIAADLDAVMAKVSGQAERADIASKIQEVFPSLTPEEQEEVNAIARYAIENGYRPEERVKLERILQSRGGL